MDLGYFSLEYINHRRNTQTSPKFKENFILVEDRFRAILLTLLSKIYTKPFFFYWKNAMDKNKVSRLKKEDEKYY